MPTTEEETQAKEFLKRAEIKTMRKDLLALRETDALKERDKIAKIRTLEEQLDEQQKRNETSASAKVSADREKAARNEVLQHGETQERIAEKDLKNYGTEQERQQIFLLESQRLGFEKEVDSIDKEKDPALKLEKNNQLLQLRDWQAKLNAILDDEKKLEDQQKFLADKAQASTIPAERKGFEESRWDLDKKVQETEKKRWEVEKQIETINNKIAQVDKSSDSLVTQKNDLKNKILGMDKSLREVYSAIIARVEESRRGELTEQKTEREAAEKTHEEENENVRRQQWSGSTAPKQADKAIKAPMPVRDKIMRTAKSEQDERKKFLQDVDSWSQTGVPLPPVPKKK